MNSLELKESRLLKYGLWGAVMVSVLLVSGIAWAGKIHKAAKKGDLDKVRELVEKDPAALEETTSIMGSTPLMEAAEGDQVEVVKFLVEKGANVQTANKEGLTAFHIAADLGSNQVLAFFLDQGIDPNLRGGGNYTALHCCCNSRGDGNLEGAKLLISKGADVKALDRNNLTPLHGAAHWGYKEIVVLLLENGADINAKANPPGLDPNALAALGAQKPDHALLASIGGSTPLHEAVNGKGSAVVLLLEKGADVNAKNNAGQTPLHRALLEVSAGAMIGPLLEHGADAKALDNSGWAPIHYVGLHGKNYFGLDSVIEKLVKAGADINAKTPDGLTALAIAAASNDAQTAAMLQRFGAK